MSALPVFDDATMTWSDPELVLTKRGLWPAAGLARVVSYEEDANEWSSAVEYRLDGELVHRSARTHVKAGIPAGADRRLKRETDRWRTARPCARASRQELLAGHPRLRNDRHARRDHGRHVQARAVPGDRIAWGGHHGLFDHQRARRHWQLQRGRGDADQRDGARPPRARPPTGRPAPTPSGPASPRPARSTRRCSTTRPSRTRRWRCSPSAPSR
jgi:hypothetical protein